MVNRENYLAVQRYLDYLDQVRMNEPETLKRRRIQLRHLLEWADETPFGQAPGIRPTFPRYLATHRNDGRTGPQASGSVMRMLGVAREFFVWLRMADPSKSRKLTDAWLETLRAPRVKQQKVTDRPVYTLEDIESIVKLPTETLTEQRDQAAIAFLFLSGLRVDAFVTLRLDCVDMAARTVKQWPALGVRTKNSKAATTYLLDIPVLLKVVQKWDDLVREQLPGKALWYASLSTNGMSLTGNTEAGVARRDMVAKGLKRLCVRAGVPYHSPHKLRHGHTVYALKLARTVSDLKAISQNIMHNSLTTTDSIYGILPSEDVAQRIAGLVQDAAARDENVMEEIRRLLDNRVR